MVDGSAFPYTRVDLAIWDGEVTDVVCGDETRFRASLRPGSSLSVNIAASCRRAISFETEL
jgi:hypothetical protein